jgi:hypothetical protein
VHCACGLVYVSRKSWRNNGLHLLQELQGAVTNLPGLPSGYGMEHLVLRGRRQAGLWVRYGPGYISGEIDDAGQVALDGKRHGCVVYVYVADKSLHEPARPHQH